MTPNTNTTSTKITTETTTNNNNNNNNNNNQLSNSYLYKITEIERIFSHVILFMNGRDLFHVITLNKHTYDIFLSLRHLNCESLRLLYMNHPHKARQTQKAIDFFQQRQHFDLPWVVDSLTSFQNNLNYLMFGNPRLNSIAKYILDAAYHYNRKHIDKFVLSGGLMLAALHANVSEAKQKFGTTDIDVFHISDETVDSHAAVQEMLFDAHERAKKAHTDHPSSSQSSTLIPSIIIRNNATINFKTQDSRLPILQIVTRKISTIDELFVFFDLDCVRFAFDGTSLFTFQESIRFLESKTNVICDSYTESSVSGKRITKYKNRGFPTITNNLYPFDHLVKPDYSKPAALPTQSNPNHGRVSDELYSPLTQQSYEHFLAEYKNDQEGNGKQRKGWYRLFRSIPEMYCRDASNYFQGFRDAYMLAKFFIGRCYICSRYQQFYSFQQSERNRLCQSCTRWNESKKHTRRNLSSKIAIVTGGRIKIGYSTALRLLRNHATVIITTRFCQDALSRYQSEPDYHKWNDRLYIYPLDLRRARSVIEFVNHVSSTFKHVDILINNAAQTVRRPAQYYSSLIEKELRMLEQSVSNETETNKASSIVSLEDAVNVASEVGHSQLNEDAQFSGNFFPRGLTDQFGEQLDLRPSHSWTYKINDVDPVEVFETQCINAIAPTMMVARLLDCMKVRKQMGTESEFQVLDDRAYIINVTSDEGHFSENSRKTGSHVHTNMSKASLNMLTRSAATYYAEHGVVMNSVDTGWISSAVNTFVTPPLECEDGTARILDPIFSDMNSYGCLFKNFKPVSW